VLKRSQCRRLRLACLDPLLWAWLSRTWSGWRDALVIVKPETVIAWHRHGFRLFWAWKSRHWMGRRPTFPRELQTLIRTMSEANPLWGAPRLHGELLKLGFSISQTTIAKYMVRRRPSPSQTWRTFLANHVHQLIAADFFVVRQRLHFHLFHEPDRPARGSPVEEVHAIRRLQPDHLPVTFQP
jgi:hypothetical protein